MNYSELSVFLKDQQKFWKLELSASTQIDYARIIKASKGDYLAYLRAAPPSTFEKRKSAILWRLRFLFTEQLSNLDEAIDNGETDLQLKLALANAYVPEIIAIVAEKMEGSRTQTGKSKRLGLKKLSTKGDWRARIIGKAGKAGLIGILILAVAGVRPIEIQKGISLKVVDSHRFDIHIKGAKYTETTGHAKRGQRHDARATPWGRRLFKAIVQAGGKLLFSRSPENLRDDVRSAAKRAELTDGISPYTFRHQFAADLKAGGWSRADQARALGHASTRTQGRYGRKNSGSSGAAGLLQVAASGVVREPERPISKAVRRSRLDEIARPNDLDFTL